MISRKRLMKTKHNATIRILMVNVMMITTQYSTVSETACWCKIDMQST